MSLDVAGASQLLVALCVHQPVRLDVRIRASRSYLCHVITCTTSLRAREALSCTCLGWSEVTPQVSVYE